MDRNEIIGLITAGAMSCDATFEQQKGEWKVSGDPTEIALVVAAAKINGATGLADPWERIDEVPFNADPKLMSVLVAAGALPDSSVDDVNLVQYTKGAPDVFPDRCTTERRGGAVADLSDKRRVRIHQDIGDFADGGLRTLAVATRSHPDRAVSFDERCEYEMTWLGLVGIADPPRTEAAEVIDRARSAGIRTIMLTGDHPRTAAAIGSAFRLSGTDAPVVGEQLEHLNWSDAAEVNAMLESTDVFARVTPEHKLELVRARQQNGNIVPTSVWRWVGSVARKAADMVLANDDFATIVTAIEEGRNIFADIRKSLRYLLASNAGEVLVMVLGVLAAGSLGLQTGEGLAVPWLATEILWINLLTDSALAPALGVDPSVEDTMSMPPRQLNDPIIDRAMWVTIAGVGTVTAIAGLVALDLELAGGFLGGNSNLVSARTMVFTTVVLAQVFNAFNARSDRVSAFVKIFENRLLWVAVAATVTLQVAVVHLGVLNRAFETTPLDVGQWLTCWGLASTVLIANEIRKLIGRRLRR